MGAGATALAAQMTKRKYIGYEVEQKYCDLAIKRLE
jgi:DNA modification methylase